MNEKGEVDYRSASKDSSLLEAYLKKLSLVPDVEFTRFSRDEKAAVFINAYNAGVILLALKHYPLKNITDIPAVWDQEVVQIGTDLYDPHFVGERTEKERIQDTATHNYSLNGILGTVVRDQFHDEKILLALCSGAKSSPRLRREAYVGARLEGQLYLAAKDFVNDPSKNQIELGAKKVILSRIFKWYGHDFLVNWSNFPEESRWDKEELAVLSFVAHYLEDPQKVDYLKGGNYKVKYQTFDWRLNEAG